MVCVGSATRGVDVRGGVGRPAFVIAASHQPEEEAERSQPKDPHGRDDCAALLQSDEVVWVDCDKPFRCPQGGAEGLRDAHLIDR